LDNRRETDKGAAAAKDDDKQIREIFNVTLYRNLSTQWGDFPPPGGVKSVRR
jgi:hypothetical protein